MTTSPNSSVSHLTKMTQALIVIPARMASTRFPNKPLAQIKGISMIERVWRIAKASTLAHKVVIATDDKALAQQLEGFAEVMMTSSTCKTGTDRVAEVAAELANFDIVFSLQGDAVLTPPWVVDAVLKKMLADASVALATPAVKLEGDAKAEFISDKKRGSSSGTCVVFDCHGKALYFSKGLLPHARDERQDYDIYRHIGLYGYRRDALLQLSQLPESKLERVEKLEQLRALENGMFIHVVEVDYQGRTHGSVDQPSDVAVVEAIIEREGELVL